MEFFDVDKNKKSLQNPGCYLIMQIATEYVFRENQQFDVNSFINESKKKVIYKIGMSSNIFKRMQDYRLYDGLNQYPILLDYYLCRE